jgi:hypothetical protein
MCLLFFIIITHQKFQNYKTKYQSLNLNLNELFDNLLLNPMKEYHMLKEEPMNFFFVQKIAQY